MSVIGFARRPANLAIVSYTTADARERILRELAMAADQIALALDYLSEAYEQADVNLADRLEEQLFAPVQAGYARARRTGSEFVARHSLPAPDGHPTASGSRPHGTRALIEASADALGQADQWIAELQDSMLPVEVGDPELRAGLSQVRETISSVPVRARTLVRTVEVGDEQLRAGLSETRSLIAPLPARAHELVRTLGR
jgi:hypothetical protein